MYRETHTRSVMKTLSWRITATLTTVALVYLFTGGLALALSVGGVEFVAKMIIYFFHERSWNAIHWGRKEYVPSVIWFTGLSGSGKSTISKQVYEQLKNKKIKVEHLDGDKIRDILPGTGFSKEARDEHIRRVGLLASMLEKKGITVVCSFVSPYEEARQFVRGLCDSFIEVYVSTPLEECEKRDVKGLYKKARTGEIQNFTGISDPYEPPSNPELNLNTAQTQLEDCVRQVLKKVNINSNGK